MAHLFCTLTEAAERLQATVDEIEALLHDGMLQEFRDGPHRLVKATDVGRLASRDAETGRRRPPLAPAAPHLRHGETAKLPRYAAATVTKGGPPRRYASPRNAPCRPGGRPSGETRPAARGSRPPNTPGHSRYTTREEPSPPSPTRMASERSEGTGLPAAVYGSRVTNRSIRPQGIGSRAWLKQWCWNGLIHDRPLVIAILSALTLLVISVVVVGASILVEGL